MDLRMFIPVNLRKFDVPEAKAAVMTSIVSSLGSVYHLEDPEEKKARAKVLATAAQARQASLEAAAKAMGEEDPRAKLFLNAKARIKAEEEAEANTKVEEEVWTKAGKDAVAKAQAQVVSKAKAEARAALRAAERAADNEEAETTAKCKEGDAMQSPHSNYMDRYMAQLSARRQKQHEQQQLGFLGSTLYAGYGYIDPYLKKACNTIPVLERAVKRSGMFVTPWIVRVDEVTQRRLEIMRPYVSPRRVKETVFVYVDGKVFRVMEFLHTQVLNHYFASLERVEQIKDFKDVKTLLGLAIELTLGWFLLGIWTCLAFGVAVVKGTPHTMAKPCMPKSRSMTKSFAEHTPIRSMAEPFVSAREPMEEVKPMALPARNAQPVPVPRLNLNTLAIATLSEAKDTYTDRTDHTDTHTDRTSYRTGRNQNNDDTPRASRFYVQTQDRDTPRTSWISRKGSASDLSMDKSLGA